MQELDKQHILKRIIEVSEELQLTAYEFAKHIGMTEVGISKILKGEVKNPNKTSLKELIGFLQQHHNINKDWLLQGTGLMKEVSLPQAKEYEQLSDSLKRKKLDEVAVFVAHHEQELMKNPIFRSIVERKGYQLVIAKLRDTKVDGQGTAVPKNG